MMNNSAAEQIIFSEPRLEFSSFNRFLWRVIYFSFYAIFFIGAVLFIFRNDIDGMRWLGILSLLFLADRLFSLNRPVHSFSELENHSFAGVNGADYLEPQGFRLLEKSFDKTLSAGGNFYLHFLKVLIKDKGIRGGLRHLEVSPEEIESKIDEEIVLAKNLKNETKEALLEKTKLLASQAFFIAYSNQMPDIGRDDFFSALSFSEDKEVDKIFKIFSVDSGDLTKAMIFSHFQRHDLGSIFWRIPKTLAGFAFHSHRVRRRRINRAWTSQPTPLLDRFSVDLTDLVYSGGAGFLIGHEKEYGEMTEILSRPANPNVILVGEPGSGKKTLVEHLAFNILKDKVPSPLFDKRVVELSIGNLIAGASPEEISQRIAEVADEILSSKNIVLYIPDIHYLTKTSGAAYLNAADSFMPIIKSYNIQVIGSTYPQEYKESIEGRADFSDVFGKIIVNEISEDDAFRILTYQSVILEKEYEIVISFSAIKEAVILAHRYFSQKKLPASALDILQESLMNVHQQGDKVLTKETVIKICERKVNVPIHRATKEEAENLLNLENIIHQNLVDQEDAVKAVSRSLREYRSGLSRSSGPIASFLFVGPTGVGKTELAKILAQTQFGSEKEMVRFDMSEYQDKQSIIRFIGSPDGKIFGSLTEAVIQKPYCLILLDEFEKASSDVLNLFLQVFDDGRLTDNLGRTVDFKNTIIIATSNANSDYIKESLAQGKSVVDIKEEFKKKLSSFFKPELLNRFSDVIIFRDLSQNDILRITEIQLKKLSSALLENQEIKLEFSESSIQYLANVGYDPVFGARPLRNAISEKIKSPLAEKILREEIKKGDSVRVEAENNELKFVN